MQLRKLLDADRGIVGQRVIRRARLLDAWLLKIECVGKGRNGRGKRKRAQAGRSLGADPPTVNLPATSAKQVQGNPSLPVAGATLRCSDWPTPSTLPLSPLFHLLPRLATGDCQLCKSTAHSLAEGHPPSRQLGGECVDGRAARQTMWSLPLCVSYQHPANRWPSLAATLTGHLTVKLHLRRAERCSPARSPANRSHCQIARLWP